MKTTTTKTGLLFSASLAYLGLLTPANAQEGPAANDLSIEEITVTAQKRAESAQDVPISMSAFASDTIENYAATSARELVNLTSGVQLIDHFGTNPTYVIRGIGLNDFRANSSPSAAVYIDEAFQSNVLGSSPQIFDVERVEVLKGPQGTLYGRNASSGAVNIITKKPTEDFEGFGRIGYGEFDRLSVQGAVSGPLAENVFYRLAGQFDQYGDSAYDYGSPIPTIRDAGDGDPYAPEVWGIRGQLQWRPSSNTDVLFKIAYSDTGGSSDNTIAVPTSQIPGSAFTCPGLNGPADRSARQGCQAGFSGDLFVVPSSEDFELSSNFTPTHDVESFSTSLRIDHSFAWSTLTAITSWDSFDFIQNVDFDATVVDALHVFHDFQGDNYAQELRLAGASDDVNWMVGVNAGYDDYREPARVLYAGTLLPDFRSTVNYIGAPGRVSPSSARSPSDANTIFQFDEQPTTTLAVFTDNEIDLTDTLSLVAGYRFTYEKREFDAEGRVIFTDGTFELADQAGIGPARGTNELETRRSSGRIGINWRPNDRTLTYALFSESFKSGGFDGGVLSNIAFIDNPYEAEVVQSIELGIKTDPLPNLRINAALFSMEFENPQTRITVFVPSPIPGDPDIAQGRLSNLDSADIFGGEAEAIWRPIDGLTLSGTVTALDTEVSEEGNNAATFDGNPLSHAPEFSYTLNAAFEAPLGANLFGRFQANMKRVGEHYLRPEAFDIDEEEYTLVDAQFAIGTNDGVWEVNVWGKNLTDEQYRVSGIASFGSVVYNIGLPRTWGVNLTSRF